MTTETEPTYLGVGAYAKRSEFGDILIYTSDGINVTNEIILEPSVVRNLLAFLKGEGHV